MTLRHLFTRLLLVSCMLGAVGCSSSTSQRSAASDPVSAILPFADIQTGEITFEGDRNDSSRAIARVTTSIPAICAIVWGTDSSFGRFNNSLSMNGTGIEQHDVVLPNIQPGATYTYVLEGVAADGTLYRSEVGTFRIKPDTTPSTTPPPPLGANVAPKATVVSVSSEFSSVFSADNAIDDDLTTEWATKDDGDSASITIELDSDTAITGVEFVTRSMADGTATTSMYTISIDGAETLGPFTAGTVAAPRPIPVAAHARQLTFQVVQTTGGNVGAVEIRVFA